MLTTTAKTTPGTPETWQREETLRRWPLARSTWRIHLQTLVSVLKDPAFAAEQEVRFITARYTEDPVERFRTTSYRGIVPYVALGLGNYFSPGGSRWAIPGPLPIRRVVTGPSAPPFAETHLRRLLDAHGYSEVQIEPSIVPFRR